MESNHARTRQWRRAALCKSAAALARTSATVRIALFRRGCAPLSWMNGTPLTAAPFDIDQQPPSAIEATEIYPSAATVPLAFRGPLREQTCGAIVLWSREREHHHRRESISADSIAPLVDANGKIVPESSGP